MPELLLADLAEYRRKKLMKGVFSPVLIQEMQRTLNEGNQIILFQNRRGYSTYLQCDCCGSILKCSHCDVSMTYYKQRDLLSCPVLRKYKEERITLYGMRKRPLPSKDARYGAGGGRSGCTVSGCQNCPYGFGSHEQ